MMKKLLLISLICFIPYTLFSKETKKTKFQCGKKRYCKQMTSCKEAIFYLKQCGLKKLDRDKDGVPCESICGKN